MEKMRKSLFQMELLIFLSIKCLKKKKGTYFKNLAFLGIRECIHFIYKNGLSLFSNR